MPDVCLAVRGSVVDSPPTYTSEHDYVTYEAYRNRSYYARALPPVPKDCPTPLGVVGMFCVFSFVI